VKRDHGLRTTDCRRRKGPIRLKVRLRRVRSIATPCSSTRSDMTPSAMHCLRPGQRSRTSSAFFGDISTRRLSAGFLLACDDGRLIQQG
jgi:hypothetical protein